MCAAAVREAWEEAHVEIKLKGVLSIEDCSHWLPGVSRRVAFLAEAVKPEGGLPLPKSIPDFESAGAVWATFAELTQLPLRAPEPVWCARHVESGGKVHPLSVLQ